MTRKRIIIALLIPILCFIFFPFANMTVRYILVITTMMYYGVMMGVTIDIEEKEKGTAFDKDNYSVSLSDWLIFVVPTPILITLYFITPDTDYYFPYKVVLFLFSLVFSSFTACCVYTKVQFFRFRNNANKTD